MFRSPMMQSLKSSFLKKTMTKLSNKDIIGSGGYGTVYRLNVNESTAFAVKRLNRGTAERDRGFERELETMGDIKHRNIVTLHGYYISPRYNLLIYELMPNGSLDAHLHGKKEINFVYKVSEILKKKFYCTAMKCVVSKVGGSREIIEGAVDNYPTRQSWCLSLPPPKQKFLDISIVFFYSVGFKV